MDWREKGANFKYVWATLFPLFHNTKHRNYEPRLRPEMTTACDVAAKETISRSHMHEHEQ